MKTVGNDRVHIELTDSPSRRNSIHVPVLAIWLIAATAAVPACGSAAEQVWEALIPMRDGVKLAANVFLPAGDGPWPVVLTRTPYAKDRWMIGQPVPKDFKPRNGDQHASLLREGYAVVVQDCRGRFRSEGSYRPFETDHVDGYDTVEWIAAQPWCNGKVGMVGGSAPGITANLAALAAPPHLTCALSNQAFSSRYHYMVFQGGIFPLMSEKWLKGQAANDQFDLPGLLQEYFTHETYGPYWQESDLRGQYEKVQIPIAHLGGWYDIFAQATLDDFQGLQQQGGGRAREKQTPLMMPNGHGALGGDLKYPDNPPPHDNVQMRWLEYWLKGVDNGVMDEPPVQYFLMGDTMDPAAPGNCWRTAESWPPASTPTPYYLQENGTLSTREPESLNSSQTYEYDPQDPVPTVGGANLQIPRGPMDQRALSDRRDILRFQTEPLAAPVTVVGKIDVVLYAGSDAPDTDWMVKLIDVYPNGYQALVVDGGLRARFREGFSQAKFMRPGETYRFSVDLWSTALVFNRGHRIAVHVTSSNYERFEPNPNTGAPYRADKQARRARNTVYHDRGHPSHIVLPVLDER